MAFLSQNTYGLCDVASTVQFAVFLNPELIKEGCVNDCLSKNRGS
jgi:hypothetical protein